MWKRAVCQWDSQAQAAQREKRGARFALTLLEDLQRSYTGTEDGVLNQLYDQLTVAHGIYKTTRRGRFAEFDKVLVDDVLKRFAGIETLCVHDLAASSGISSLELFRALDASRRVELHFSDLYDRLHVVRVPDSNWDVVFDSAGHALEYVGHGFALSASKGESRRHPVNRLLKRMLDRSLLPRADQLLDLPQIRKGGSSNEHVRDVLLLHPECLRALDEFPNFEFRRHDLFTPLQGRYHVLRAMNIFNPGYFAPEQIAAGVGACAGSLEDGGLFVIGRTIEEEDGRTRATAFERNGKSLSPIWDFNGGAENKSLIDGLNLASHWQTDAHHGNPHLDG
jgi:hypothetical protein